MIQLIGGSLYQWDLNRQVLITSERAIDEVHIARKGDKEALVVEAKNVDGEIVADIPNILLQTSDSILVYIVSDDITIEYCSFSVNEKPKPADYIYTESEVLTWAALDERIQRLENNLSEPVTGEQIQEAVNSYLEDNPVAAYDDTALKEQIKEVQTDVANKVSLPTDTEGNIIAGEVGQILVSNGNGSTSWLTVINGNEVKW